MRPCPCCARYREDDTYHWCEDRCPWCLARRIQFIRQLLAISKEEKTRRSTEAIALCKDWNLDEAQVRALIKQQTFAVQPYVAPAVIEKKGKK